MDFDEMCDVRDAWVSAEVEGAVAGLLGLVRWTELGHAISKHAGSGNLGKALIAAYIAVRDLHADNAEEIADRLQAKRLVVTIDTDTVVDSLVRPVIWAVRGGRAGPGSWWDVGERFELLLELWAAEQSLLHSPDMIRRDLIELWDVLDEPAQDAIITNEYTPYVHLPSDLLEGSPTGHLAVIAMRGTLQRVLQKGVSDNLLDHPAAQLGRPDLIELLRRIHIRHRFEGLLSKSPMPDDLRTAVAAEFTIWDEALQRCISAMTVFEAWLMSQADDDCLFRRRVLTAVTGVELEEFQVGEALPVRADLAADPYPAPSWIADHVIAEGARNWHRWIGPYPIWFTTAETKLHEELLRGLLTKVDSWEFGYAFHSEAVQLSLLVPDDCEDGNLQLYFNYPLADIKHAWELLHVAEAGYVRLTVLRLTDPGEVLVVGADAAILPDELREDIRTEATQALRRLIGDDMNAVVQAFTTYDARKVTIRAFEICENAKGEDLIDELSSWSNRAENADHWARFRRETQAVAKARAALAEAQLDGRNATASQTSLLNAIEHRQRALEVARSGRKARAPIEDRFDALVALLPDEDTAFIHLTIAKGALYAVCLSKNDSQPLAEMSYLRVPVDELKRINHAWARAGLRARAELTHYGDGGLAALRDVARGIVASAPEATRRLIISPASPLEQLPLHAIALHADHGNACMLDCYDEVVYAPSLRLLSHLNTSQPASGPPTLISHSGAGIPGFKPLNGPQLETTALSGLYPDATILTEDSATRDAALQAMTGARIVNLSGHAFNDTDRWNSGLALAGTSLGSSILTSGHVLAHPDLHGTELLTLNACRTAGPTSSAHAVQTLRGIDGAFLARGVRSVVSTLWEVYDPCALVFSILLHASIAMGNSPGKAYRRAVDYLRNSGWRNLYISLAQAPECYLQDFLDTNRPQWRAELEAYGTDHLAVWGAFKIAGLTW